MTSLPRIRGRHHPLTGLALLTVVAIIAAVLWFGVTPTATPAFLVLGGAAGYAASGST